MSIQDLLVVGLTIIALAAVAYAFYIRLRAKRFTRERYAFAFLTGSTGLFLVVVTTLLVEPPWIAALTNLFHHWLPDFFPQPAQAHWITRTLVLLGFIVLVLLQYRIWRHWSGSRSVRQVDAERNREQISVLEEGVIEGRRLIRREPAPEVSKETLDHPFDTIIEPPTDSLAWRDQARELIELRWPSLRFDPQDGWHDREDAWVGKNLRTNRLAAILVLRTAPTEAQIERFVDYVQELPGYHPGNNALFIVVQKGIADTVLEVHGERIEQYSESKLLDSLVDFSDYFDEIRRRVQVDKLPDSDLTLHHTYVRSHLLKEDYQPLGQDLEAFLRDWMQEPSQRQIAVFGEYGQGKSTGAWLFAYHLIQDHNEHPPRVPLVIELRGKSPATLQPIELLAAWAAHRGLNPRALMKLLIAGRLILIFEGFDEMAEVGDTEARLKHFRNLWRFCYPQSKLVFTGRPNFLLDQQERRIALGIDESSGSGPYCQAVRLGPFAPEQIRASLRWAPDRVTEEILALAEKDQAFFDIVARPSLLFLVANLWDTPEFKAQRAQINSATVIGLFIKNTLRRQTEKSRHHHHFMTLNESERAYFMDGIAAYMAHHDLPNQISLRQLDEVVERLYQEIPEAVSQSPDARQTSSGRPLKSRLQDREDALELVKTDVRTYGLLVEDPSTANSLRFGHKSFLERLAAGVFLDLMAATKAGGTDDMDARSQSIMKATQVSLMDGLKSPQSLSFLGQLCASQPDMLANPSLTGKGILSLSPIDFRCLWKNKLNAMLDIHLFLRRQTNYRSRSKPFLGLGWGWGWGWGLVLGWVLGLGLGWGWVLVLGWGLDFGFGLVLGLGMGLGMGLGLGMGMGLGLGLGLGSGSGSGLDFGFGLVLGLGLSLVLGWVFYGIMIVRSKALPRTTVWLAAGIAAGMSHRRMVKIVGRNTAAEIAERLYAVLDEKTMEQAGFWRTKIQE